MGKEERKLIDLVADTPGWRVAITKKGWICFPPDARQSPVLVHGTNSDHRWRRNTVALLRQRGWEEPK